LGFDEKNLNFNTMSPYFDEGFSPFNSKQNSEVYSFYNYISGGSYLASYCSLTTEKYLLEQKDKTVNIKAGYALRSTREHYDSDLPDVMEQVFPLFVLIIYTLPYMYLLQNAVTEKQTKTRESMRMMGMKDSAYWASWFIAYFCQVMVVTIIMTLGSIFTLFKGSNPLLVFLMYFVYGISLFGFALIMIAIFGTVRTVALGGLVLKFALFYMRYLFTSSVPTFWRAAGAIFPPLNLTMMNPALWQLQTFQSLSFSTLNFTAEHYSVGLFFIMAAFGFIFWILLGLYITYIVPTEFGTNRHPCFCLMFKKRRQRNATGEENASLLLQNNSSLDSEALGQVKPNFERVGNELKELESNNQCLKIQNLSKIYPNGFKAVDDLSLTMYSGQIFALLGHNGAGKTTTISVLTGLFGATSGRAEAFGIDLLNDQDEARKIMGVCPQHNVLFPLLTPEEHLDIFCDFKGVPNDRRAEAIEKSLISVDLVDKKDTYSKLLSGGQQRKVSVGIAMLGDSKVVLLDEPTSGMDPTARRRLWDLLKNNKDDKIIILTTHYMEEADILGDRIAIMANGDAQCCGSSMYLKKKFGVGYNLTIEKTSQHDAPQIDEFVRSRIPNAIKLSEVSSEISFQLPNAAIENFKNFFNEIDNNLADLEIKSYGIGVTTLEEVFLKVGDGMVTNQKFESESINASPEEKANDDYCLVDDSVKGWSLRLLQLKAMIKARILMTIRECRVLFLEIFYPTLLIVIAAVIQSISTSSSTGMYSLSLSSVPAPQIVAWSYNPVNIQDKSRAEQFINTYYNNNGLPFESQFIDTEMGADLNLTMLNFDQNIMDLKHFNQDYFSVFVEDIDDATNSYNIITFIDPTQNAAPGYAVQGTMSAIMRDVTGDKDMKFNLERAAFPRSKSVDKILKIVLTMITVFSYSISMGIITSSIAGNICKERAESIKHQQIVSGGSRFSYWVAMFFVDLLKFAFPGMSFIIVILAFGMNIPLFWLFNILCILSLLPFTYFITFILTKESVARNVVRLLHIFLGAVMAIITFGFMQSDKTKVVGNIFNWIFKWNPTFTFSNGLIVVLLGSINESDEGTYDHFGLNEAGGDLLFLVLQFGFYFFMILLIENKFFKNRRGEAVRMAGGFDHVDAHAPEQSLHGSMILDPDVQEEEERVARMGPDELEVRANLLNKIYHSNKEHKHAVKDVSFGISFGECFALLGINGAGKTTTFKALTGDVTPTSGEVHIGGFDVQNRLQYSEARRLIGYCPQFDAIFTNLTVKEHLEFYAHIKGVVPGMRRTVVERQLVEMGLEEYKNTHANRLSGGNKRKLSVAMAMIGNPPIVFLDEPSTGMDPKAKRFMWNIIAKISTLRKKSAVILTTHSMEEAEALSTKLGIMVDGQFKCFGSAQHIKNKFGDGYEVEIKIQIPSEGDITELMVRHQLQAGLIVNNNNMQQILDSFEAGYLIGEIRPAGLGDHVDKELMKGGMKIRNFIEFIMIERSGLSLLYRLAEDFEHILLVEHYGNSYTVKLTTFEGSVGVLFGKFEEEYKVDYNIEEYSVSQTSLEQIFNTFAKQQYTLSQNSRIFKRRE